MKRAPALLGLALAATCIASCHTARVLAPPPAVRIASAALYALNVEFAQSLDRTSAGDVAHFTVRPAGEHGAPAIASATPMGARSRTPPRRSGPGSATARG